MASTEIILAIANVVFIIIAIFLFVRLRKMEKKGEPEKKQQSELAGISNITPEEFKPDISEIKAPDIVQPEKPMTIESAVDAEPKIGIQEKPELKLEDELPEVAEKPLKKESKKKKAAKKALEEAIEQAIKEETGAPSVKITISETEEEKPVKKESKKKKPAKKEQEKAIVSPITVKTSPPVKPAITETKEEKPAKKETKKKKATKQK